MGSTHDPFISPVEAAKLLDRTPEEVVRLCDEGLIRRKSTGQRILVHKGDVLEVRETNLHDTARPTDLVRRVLILERQVRSLTKTLELYGAVNGMLSSSLDNYEDQDLVAISEGVISLLSKDQWSIDEMLRLCEIFLRISDSDILRLNDTAGVHDSWRNFYSLCLRMNYYARETKFPPGQDIDLVRSLLPRGLRNLRSIGVMFIENAAFMKSSQQLLAETMSHDLAEFDTLMKQFKQSKHPSELIGLLQNS